MSIASMRRFGCALLSLSLSLSLLVGCGAQDSLGRKAVSGSVTLNGSPVQQGSVSFEQQGSTTTASGGAPIKDGNYTIARDMGLPPGTYRVRVNIPKPGTGAAEDMSVAPGEAPPPAVEMAPPEWNSKSTQSVEVKADAQEPVAFDFEVKSKK